MHENAPIDRRYDRVHRLSSPEHAANFASALGGPDVKVTVDGCRVRIVTTVRKGENYSEDRADKAMEEWARDSRPRSS
jgi:hypothetical protein